MPGTAPLIGTAARPGRGERTRGGCLVELIRLSFADEPVRRCASILSERALQPDRSLVVTPTQRFKSYLAAALLDRSGGMDLLAPALLTAEELTELLVSSIGLPIASEVERLSLLYTAFTRTPGVEWVFPQGFLSKFSRFGDAARRVLRAFDELNREEIDPREVEKAGVERGLYHEFGKHAAVYRSLFEEYGRAQTEAGTFDRSFLLGRIGGAQIDAALGRYETLLLASPVSLTRFEQRVWERMGERLTVVYQDTPDYDFSNVLTAPALRGSGPFQGKRGTEGEAAEGGDEPAADPRGPDRETRGEAGPRVIPVEVPSGMSQLAAVLSIVEGEILGGTPQEGIAVINADRAFCETLNDSLLSLGIETNFSGGFGLAKSALFGLLDLAGSLFESGLDAGRFLELIANPLFDLLAGIRDPMTAYGEILEYAKRRRLFRLRNVLAIPSAGIMKSAAFTLLEKAYRAKSFPALAETLGALFAPLRGDPRVGGLLRFSEGVSAIPRSREKAVSLILEIEEARDAILSSAIELEDCVLPVEESPFEILLQYLRSGDFPAPGNTGRGIQIVGLLETRGIRFGTVIVPSFNESFFPAPPGGDLLLGLELRRALELPTALDGEDLEFYYLKRLVDSAKVSYLVSIADPAGKAEAPSRYRYLLGTSSPEPAEIGRVLPVMPRRGGGWRPAAPGRSSISRPILAKPVREFSRADVDLIKTCETKYYIAKLMKIESPAAIRRDIEADVAGTEVHALFKELYDRYDPATNPADFGFYKARLTELFDARFREGFFYTKEEVLFFRLLKDNLLQVVERDVERFKIGYRVCREMMEKAFTSEIGPGPSDFQQENRGRFTLRGRIDRVDRSPAGRYAVLDYKTGKVPDRGDHFEKKGFRAVQLGIYGLLFRSAFPDLDIERLGYIDVTGEKDVVAVVEGEGVKSYLDSFEGHLLGFLRGFNEKRELSLAEDPASCTYCPYQGVCRVYER